MVATARYRATEVGVAMLSRGGNAVSAACPTPACGCELCLLSLSEIVLDGDEAAAEVYDLQNTVARYVATDVVRAIVDANRKEDDFSRDGVVRTHTCQRIPIWWEPLGPEAVRALLVRHRQPDHARLSRPGEGLLLGVHRHTMAAHELPSARDAARERFSETLPT